mgnify:CR=1 FL=1
MTKADLVAKISDKLGELNWERNQKWQLPFSLENARQAVFAFKGEDDEAVLENLMMADIDVTDVELEDGIITVYAPHTEFFKIKTEFANSMPEFELEVEEITWVPQTYVNVEGDDDLANFEKFIVK